MSVRSTEEFLNHVWLQQLIIQELELKDGKDRESCWKIKDKRNEDIQPLKEKIQVNEEENER